MTTTNNEARVDALSDDHLEALKCAALAATPQDIDTAEETDRYSDGSHVECPACGGEGSVPRESEFCNYDGEALGVQFFGVGNAVGAAEAYFRAASPAKILQLIARLERAEFALRTGSPLVQMLRDTLIDTSGATPADAQAAVTQDRYFVYDPECRHVDFYPTDHERNKAHLDAINEYRREARHDQEWPTEVEGIISGVVTHTTVAIQVHDDSYEYEPRTVSVVDVAHGVATNGPAGDAAVDLAERALIASGQWASSDTPIAHALAYRDGFIAGVISEVAAGRTEPIGWFDKDRNTLRWREGLVNESFSDGQPFYTRPPARNASPVAWDFRLISGEEPTAWHRCISKAHADELRAPEYRGLAEVRDLFDAPQPTAEITTPAAVAPEHHALIDRAANICQVAEYHDTANSLRALLVGQGAAHVA
ncbi:hypothetical protein VI03_25305 [Burkholderia vietnamiensis]|uniref:hypothetical protein n=1 Tax=Burkholderia vietnamiensis TaxID=60552 RepID=UPI000621B222|nr:hypothetical protein [Burkholderia vietnamiensis]KKI36097.1 hypothetical protein VI03_25305 [Burkholderia vietnamiensis]MBR8189142.1 hypothetical protein [Burkholderia vietnamiensis]